MSQPPAFRDFLPELIAREALPPHKLGHQPRLYRLCSSIGEDLEYDDDVVFAAVWLHDLGVFEGNRPSEPRALERWDHVAYAVKRTREILAQTDFPAAKVEHVLSVIEQHQPKDDPRSIEATIVRDADILEQLGAIAVMRTVAKLGSDTRFVHFADASSFLSRQLSSLPALLRLPRSRELAEPRLVALRSFLSSLDAETGDLLG